MMIKKIRYNLKDVVETSEKIVDLIYKNKNSEKATVVFLNGNLGAGKTTLVQNIAKKFEIKKNIISPTFVISKEYKINNNDLFKKLIHIDAYRLGEGGDIFNIGLQIQLEKKSNLIFIEWPEKLGKNLAPDLEINIEIEDEKTREILVKA